MLQRDARTTAINCTLLLHRLTDAPGRKKEYEIINISRGGLCFASHNIYDLNEVLQVDIIKNRQAIHSASGRVCYRTRVDKENLACYGLSFLDHFIDGDLIRHK